MSDWFKDPRYKDVLNSSRVLTAAKILLTAHGLFQTLIATV